MYTTRVEDISVSALAMRTIKEGVDWISFPLHQYCIVVPSSPREQFGGITYVYSRVHVLLMPIKWKLQDFFVADFLSHLVETETELSLSRVVVGSVVVVGSD